jgi:hypothetical protein
MPDHLWSGISDSFFKPHLLSPPLRHHDFRPRGRISLLPARDARKQSGIKKAIVGWPCIQ